MADTFLDMNRFLALQVKISEYNKTIATSLLLMTQEGDAENLRNLGPEYLRKHMSEYLRTWKTDDYSLYWLYVGKSPKF